MSMEKVIIFGTGGYYKKYMHKLDGNKVEIIAFIDNNTKIIGSRFQNKPVLSPKDVNSLDYDKIVIMSSFMSEITQQLIRLNVEARKIYVYEEYHNEFVNCWKIYYSLNYMKNLRDKNCKKVIVVTHELSLTGAPLVLKYVVQALKEEGYMPIIVSPKNGPLIDEFIKQDVTVIISSILCLENLELKEIIDKSSLVIVNTLSLYSVVEELSKEKIKVLWWLHEGKYSYKVFDILGKRLQIDIGGNVNIFSDGEYAKKFWDDTKSNMSAKVLTYGVPDRMKENDFIMDYRKSKIIFSIVGTIEPRKGQDIFVKAVKYIPKKYKEKIECWIVGRVTDVDFKRDLLKLSENIEQIKYVDEMPNNDLMRVYRDSSMLVSASRDDPMPVVLADGMMMKRACICSDNTGTASLINNWEDGVVFHSENYKELANIMIRVIDNPDCIGYMGNNARRIYEKIFIYSVFKENLLKEINHILR